MLTGEKLSGEKLLITGATGQVALPVALDLAQDNEVWAAARFSDPKAKARLEEGGVHCVTADFITGDLRAVPEDFAYLLNFSVVKTGRWGDDLDGNAGGLGALMHHCRAAKAVLHCSSTAVYQPDGHRAFVEDDPLGDNHRVLDFLATYSISKIATEAMARFTARHLNLPTTVARLNVPYGDYGGWPSFMLEMMRGGMAVPVHRDAPSVYNPIHHVDIVGTIPKLLQIASVPVTTVNWAGDESSSIEDWCNYFTELTGLEAKFEPTDVALASVKVDTTRFNELAGHTTIGWKEGMRRMVANLHPELLKA